MHAVRSTNHLLTLTALFVLVPAGWASWGTTYRNLGTTVVAGEPECADFASQDVVCLAQNQQHTLMANEFKNNTWSGWTNIAGVVSSNASCVNDKDSRVVCGVRNANNVLAVTVFNGTAWSVLIGSGGQIYSNPSCALLRKDAVFCTARGLTGGLTSALFNSVTRTWSTFVNAAAVVTSDPGCAGDSDGDVICAVNAIISNVNVVAVNRYSSGRWQGFLNLQGGLSSGPSCKTLGIKGQVMCFVRSTNSAQYERLFLSGQWTTSNWTGWRGISGGSATEKVSCALLSPATGALACATSSTADGYLYTASFDGTNWTAFVKTGNKPIWSSPSCAALAAGRATCTVVLTNNLAASVTGP